MTRVFAISDIHLDFPANLKWLTGLSMDDYQNDILILAGDVSDVPYLLNLCFETLAKRFKKVLFVPGNHDLWVVRLPEKMGSIDKFHCIASLAEGFGISTQPYHSGPLSIVPLLGWYDYSFGQPSAALREAWMDFHACTWPEGFDAGQVTEFFTSQNEASLAVRNQTVISFSHFLPRIDLMPSYIPAQHQILFPVLGSSVLERQLRRLGPSIHVYGHSHVNQQLTLDGVLYINNAYGSPGETRISAKKLLCIHEQ